MLDPSPGHTLGGVGLKLCHPTVNLGSLPRLEIHFIRRVYDAIPDGFDDANTLLHGEL